MSNQLVCFLGIVILLTSFDKVFGQIVRPLPSESKVENHKGEMNLNSADSSYLTEYLKRANLTDSVSHWDVVLENYFIQDADSTYFGEGVFSDYSVQRNISVAGIPINLQGNLVLQNNIVNKRFTGIKVKFDADRFTKSYLQKVITNDLLKKSEDKLLSGKNALSMPDATVAKNIITDRLEKTKAEITNLCQDSLLRLEREIDTVQKLKNEVKNGRQQVVNEKGRIENLENHSLDTLGTLIKGQSGKIESVKDTVTLHADTSGIASKIRKLDSIAVALNKKVIFFKNRITATQSWVKQQQKTIDNLKGTDTVLNYADQLPRSFQSAPQGLDTLLNAGLLKDTVFQRRISELRDKAIAVKINLMDKRNKISEWDQWAEKKEMEWNELNDPNKLKTYAGHQNFIISPFHKILLGLRNFDIGLVTLHESPLTITSLPVHGFSAGGQFGKYRLALGWGKEGETDNEQTTSFIRNTNRYGLNRKALHLKTGIGNEGESFYTLTFSHLTAGLTPDFPEVPVQRKTENILLGLQGQQYVNKQLFVGVNTVLSNTDVSGTFTGTELLQSINEQQVARSAIESQLGYKSKNGTSVLEAGYSYIGSSYQTLGNPFLITDRRDIKVKLKQQLFKKRLVINGEARISTKPKDNSVPGFKQNLYALDGTYRLKRNGQLWLKYQPAAFSQKVGTLTSSVQMNTVVVGYQVSALINKSLLWNGILQTMNFRQESNLSDTAFTAGRWYVNTQQSLIYGKNIFTVMSYGGFDKTHLKEGQIGLNNTLSMKNFQVDLGSQIIKRPFDQQLRWGITGGGSKKIKKMGNAGVNCTWLWAINEDRKSGIYITSFVRISL